MPKLSVAPTLLLAASAALTGCDNQTARIDAERAEIRRQMEFPEINGNQAVFRIYGDTVLVEEFRLQFRDHAEVWAMRHNARPISETGSSNLSVGGADYTMRYELPTEKND